VILIKLFGGRDNRDDDGNMQEIMDLSLDKSKYEAGETVRGKLVISRNNDFNARNFHFIAEGKEETEITVTERSYYNTTYYSTHDVTYRESNVFFSINLEHFLSKNSSNPSFIENTDKGIIIHKGRTEISFEFPLPNNALSTYKGKKVSINYEVKATIDKKFRSDTNALKSFDVVSINQNNNINTSSAIHASDKSSDNSLNLVVAKNIYKQGDTIEGTIFIGNPNSTTTATIRGIKIVLVTQEYATARGKNETTIIQSIDNEIPNWKFNEETPFQIKVPETITKSYRSKLSELYWEIKANVDIPMDSDLNAISRIEII
jgi:hypothetical protein